MTYPPLRSYRPPEAERSRRRPQLAREPLLELDPDLGRYLSPERRAMVEPLLWMPVVEIERGPWRNVRSLAGHPADIGVLLVSGLVARELRIDETPSAELLGSGDIIRRADAGGAGTLEPPLAWTALKTTRAAVLDRSVAATFYRYPELMMAVLDRISAHAQRLSLTQAISHLTGVNRRLEALFWQLADRWGKVTTRGVVVPLHLSHRVLASLVGARRPTVSTALAQLADTGRVVTHPSGGWLLTGGPPATDRHDDGFVEHRAPRGSLRSSNTGAV